jgi:ribosomal-protein-alanine N-acetyltransferase
VEHFENNTIEVGYGLNPAFQNKGIMTEALKCVIDYGFNELKLIKIEAFTHYKMRALKNIRKTGFHFMENRKIKTMIPTVSMNSK